MRYDIHRWPFPFYDHRKYEMIPAGISSDPNRYEYLTNDNYEEKYQIPLLTPYLQHSHLISFNDHMSMK